MAVPLRQIWWSEILEMEKSILISILSRISLKKAKLTGSIRHIIRILKSGIPIYNSKVPDTADRKTKSRRRTQAITKTHT